MLDHFAQQTSPLPATDLNHHLPIPRHASLTPSYQHRVSVSRQRPPPLPFRPKSQIFHSPPVLQQQQQQYSAPIASYIEAPQPLPKPSYQNPYVPQPSGASAGYNPQTYSPASPPTQQETQVPTPRPQSAYQPLSFPIYLNGAPIQQQ
ncbi:hypothetical protein WAI453_006877 [Rhynchosporium graminicola]